MASGSTPVMRVNMQLATSPTWRWSHQNCLNMCLESYNHAVSPPGKEEPCIYTKAAFASHFKTTSTATHGQTKVHLKSVPNNRPTTKARVGQASTHLKPHLWSAIYSNTVSNNPRSNAGNRSTTCHLSNHTSLPPNYALSHSNNSSAPRTSWRPMGPHDFRNGLHRLRRLCLQAQPDRDIPLANCRFREARHEPKEEIDRLDGCVWGQVQFGGHRAGNGNLRIATRRRVKSNHH
ncbi:hypothetical protein FJTKL_06321 [Diaporthe vaccinii]|uniref:Uncharacterized protein n=1 Tax=Diaporthe vaccinii TaxID=105482 RepID=A0ABR4DQQ9_9PEZI